MSSWQHRILQETNQDQILKPKKFKDRSCLRHYIQRSIVPAGREALPAALRQHRCSSISSLVCAADPHALLRCHHRCYHKGIGQAAYLCPLQHRNFLSGCGLSVPAPAPLGDDWIFHQLCDHPFAELYTEHSASSENHRTQPSCLQYHAEFCGHVSFRLRRWPDEYRTGHGHFLPVDFGISVGSSGGDSKGRLALALGDDSQESDPFERFRPRRTGFFINFTNPNNHRFQITKSPKILDFYIKCQRNSNFEL